MKEERQKEIDAIIQELKKYIENGESKERVLKLKEKLDQLLNDFLEDK